jgi:hypothetical protein
MGEMGGQVPEEDHANGKRALVDRMANMINGTGELLPETELMYVSAFPHHVEKCCDMTGHLTEADVWGLDSVRQDVDREISEVLMDSGQIVKFLDWWTCWGLRRTPQ